MSKLIWHKKIKHDDSIKTVTTKEQEKAYLEFMNIYKSEEINMKYNEHELICKWCKYRNTLGCKHCPNTRA